MVSVTIRATVGAERQLTIDLPDDIPAGAVEVTITPIQPVPEPAPGEELTPERAGAILAAAGLLRTTRYEPPPDAARLTAEEEEELGRLFGGEPDMATLISEGREERWD